MQARPRSHSHSLRSDCEPLPAEVVDDEDDGAYGPGEGVSPEDYVNDGYKVHDDCDVCDTQQAPAAEHYDHGYGGFAGAAVGSRKAVAEGQEEVE